MVLRFTAVGLVLAGAVLAGSCSQVELSPALQPLSQETMTLLAKRGMTPSSPIFVRIFKEESELEIWKMREDGRFYHFKTYPICNWSGTLGPKLHQGDMQAPEGFYTVSASQMNPNSQYHLAFNLGYPNAYDRAHGRTGEYLMVHGKCRSAGCYAMTDALMEEIYALAREAFIGGQPSFEVHAFPFRMTDANMQRHRASPHYRFWSMLKEGYDHFEVTRQPPSVAVCERRYVVNVRWSGGELSRLNPKSLCPPFERPPVVPFTPLEWTQRASAESPLVGTRMRSATTRGEPGNGSGAFAQAKLGRMFGLGASPGSMSD
ncbi:MAG TPA: murein L,D-transpeptidase family protein [Hyphomicrobiaceae bacterium]|nr:murein L,D-transpeptidase family protein [Hyphomicrobiaceae bacterium]